MTLTIKETLDVAGEPKPGSPERNSENHSNFSPRSNPVCLEVPVTIRSLPGENSDTPGAPIPMREEGRSVIVFDNGGVLRVANPLPPGQKVILSNHQGRDVVCQVVGGRNLPSVKGYIEVEFVEPVNDFWRIHQTQEPVNVPPPPAMAPLDAATHEPAAAQAPERPPAAPSALPAVSLDPVVATKQANAPAGGAPTFEDIAGIVLMSPSGQPLEKKYEKKQVKKSEPAAPSSSLKSKDGSTQVSAETAKLNYPNRPVSSASEFTSDISAPSPAPVAFSAPARKQPLSIDLTGGGGPMSASVPSSFASTSGESRGRMTLLLGGAALVLAGLGAGYFFMHRGTAPDPAGSVAVASQPSAPSADASSGPGIAPVAQPAVDQTPSQAAPQTAQPVQIATSASSGILESAPSDSSDTQQRLQPADAKQADRTAARRQPILNLKMSSPTGRGQNLANLPDSSSMASVEVVSATAPGGISPGAFAGRGESQPAPPSASISMAAPAQSVQVARLISSTHPVYPAMAKASNVQGRVILEASIDEKGNVASVKATGGPMFLRQAAVDAVKYWKYTPALIGGKPAASQVTVTLDFRLN